MAEKRYVSLGLRSTDAAAWASCRHETARNLSNSFTRLQHNLSSIPLRKSAQRRAHAARVDRYNCPRPHGGKQFRPNRFEVAQASGAFTVVKPSGKPFATAPVKVAAPSDRPAAARRAPSFAGAAFTPEDGDQASAANQDTPNADAPEATLRRSRPSAPRKRSLRIRRVNNARANARLRPQTRTPIPTRNRKPATGSRMTARPNPPRTGETVTPAIRAIPKTDHFLQNDASCKAGFAGLHTLV